MPYEVTQVAWPENKSLKPKAGHRDSRSNFRGQAVAAASGFEATFGDKGYAGYRVSNTVTSHEAQLEQQIICAVGRHGASTGFGIFHSGQ